MIWSGLLALLAGAVVALAVHGDVAGVDARAAGVILLIIGAVLLVSGIMRLNRRGPRVARYQDRVYRTGKGKIIAMIAAVIYIVSPIDIVPDFLLPVGIIDDAGALTWLLFAIGQELGRKRRGAL